jgi:hypothetical protein
MVAARLIKKPHKDRYEPISLSRGSQTGSYRYAQNIGADTNVNDFKAIETLRRMPQCDNRPQQQAGNRASIATEN